MPESRNYNTEYYDAFTQQTADTNFYLNFVDQNTEILELGCGTGRVSQRLAGQAKYLTGVDISEAMIKSARSRTEAKNLNFVLGDITDINLNKEYDLILAPFRVMQALEKKEQIEGLFHVIKSHLSSDGVAILNVFNPYLPKEKMEKGWVKENENPCGERLLSNGDVVKMFDTRKKIDVVNQVLHPNLIYRRYRDGELIDEHINPICMRYYYPKEFKSLIESFNFNIVQTWGGYNNEVYGEGPELVVSFKK